MSIIEEVQELWSKGDRIKQWLGAAVFNHDSIKRKFSSSVSICSDNTLNSKLTWSKEGYYNGKECVNGESFDYSEKELQLYKRDDNIVDKVRGVHREVFQILQFINYRDVRVLVDTGATLCSVSPALAKGLSQNAKGCEIVDCEPFTISTAIDSSNKFMVEKVLRALFMINGQQFKFTFAVIPNASDEMVLGMDFLCRYSVHVLCGIAKIVIGSPEESIDQGVEHERLRKQKKDEVPRVEEEFDESVKNNDKMHGIYTDRPYEVRPNGWNRVRLRCAYTMNKEPTKEVLIESNPVVEHKYGIKILNTVTSMQKGYVHIYIVNATDRHIKIPRGLHIGFIQDGIEIIPFDDKVDEKIRVFHNSTHDEKGEDKETHTSREETPYLSPEQLSEFKIDSELGKHQKQQLYELLQECREAFAFRDEDVGTIKGVQVKVHTGDHPPAAKAPYKASFKEREIMREQCEKDLRDGVIQESNSPYAAPCVLVPKKDGSYRMCIDFRLLNKQVTKNFYPLPLIQDIFDRFQGACYFSSLDARNGFHQLKVHPKYRYKLAFVTPDGKYECIKLPFGYINSAADFQQAMDRILGSLKWTIAMVYIDDITIWSTTWEEHIMRLRTVLNRLIQHNVKLKPNKCHFGFKKLNFLGHTVSKEGIAPDPQKIEAVQAWSVEQLKCVKDVQKSLGLFSYYRKFVKNFSIIAKPLTELLKAESKVDWHNLDESVKNAFEMLKTKLIEAPILAFPHPDGKIRITTDGCGYGIAAILEQAVGTESYKPLAYASRTLTDCETRYTITEIECLAVVFAIQKFRQYIHGQNFVVKTDHHSLQYLLNLKDPNSRLARWQLKLQGYDYVIEYKPGVNIKHVDALSRFPIGMIRKLMAHGRIISKGNGEIIDEHYIVKDYIDGKEERLEFCRSIQIHEEVDMFEAHTDFNKDKVKEAQRKDKDIAHLIMRVKDMGTHEDDNEMYFKNFALIDDILYKANTEIGGRMWKLIIPKDLRYTVVSLVHDAPGNEHPGYFKAWEKIKSRFWWKHMAKDTKAYIDACEICQKYNIRNKAKNGPFHIVKPSSQVFSRCAIDFIGPLPMTDRGNRHALTIIDQTSRFVMCIPCVNNTCEDAIEAIKNNLLYVHGWPKAFVADNGGAFIGFEFTTFCQAECIKVIYTAARHPQSNGNVENSNKTIKKRLAKALLERNVAWDLLLPRITFSINTQIHHTTKFAPSYLVYGRHLLYPVDRCLPVHEIPEMRTPIERQKDREMAVALANRNTNAEQERRKESYEAEHPICKFKKGDLVLYNCRVNKVGGKFDKIRDGPYKIVKITGENSYIIHRVTPMHGIKNTFKVVTDSIKKYHKPVEVKDKLYHPYKNTKQISVTQSPKHQEVEPEISVTISSASNARMVTSCVTGEPTSSEYSRQKSHKEGNVRSNHEHENVHTGQNEHLLSANGSSSNRGWHSTQGNRNKRDSIHSDSSISNILSAKKARSKYSDIYEEHTW